VKRSNNGWRGVLADVERAATRAGRSRTGCFAIEGTRLHERALRAGITPRAVLVARSATQSNDTRTARLLAQLERSGCELHEAPDEALESHTGGRDLGPFLGLLPLPEPVAVAAALDHARGRPPVLLVASEIEDPGNVGALVRTAVAGGADLFVALGITEPFHPKAVRTSMGAIFRLPVHRAASVEPLHGELEVAGVRSFGATTDGEPVHTVRFGPGPVALWVGSEAFGLGDRDRDALEGTVTVPMHASIDSYSVNAATAILLYEIRRPRG
jgi:TrmH family RNA methyltransferase